MCNILYFALACGTNTEWVTSRMSTNHFRLHVSPFQVNKQNCKDLATGDHFGPPKSRLIAFLTISDK